MTTFLEHNFYLINNNEARNYGIMYGKENNYEWTFVLDSNQYFTHKSYIDIISNINIESEYIVIPQKRLKDNNINNNDIISNDVAVVEDIINNLPVQEPQIAFKNSSQYMFNPEIPYGLSPKAEILVALNVPGKWHKWIHGSYFKSLNITPRKFNDCKFQTLSQVIRLHPHNDNNDISKNYILRWEGIYLLAKKIQESL